jgi:hypothetical protein
MSIGYSHRQNRHYIAGAAVALRAALVRSAPLSQKHARSPIQDGCEPTKGKKMIKKIAIRLLPLGIRATLRNYKILSLELGQYKTICRWDCVDRYNNPIPWYSYPAIEYIKQLDFSDKIVFEYGSGNSTIFWAPRCKKLVSVEDNQQWYNKVKAKLADNVEYTLFNEKEKYINSIDNYAGKFDIVIIDGSHRYECSAKALQNLKDDGFIILDNSDWKEKTSEVLRGADLIEVDMCGFGPINGYTTTTSFYFTRNVKLKPAYDRQPVHGIGSLHHSEA